MDLHMHPPVSDREAVLVLSLGVVLSVVDVIPEGVESEEDILAGDKDSTWTELTK